MAKRRFLFIGFCVVIMMLSNFACAASPSGSAPDDKLLITNYELGRSKLITNYSFDIHISVFIPGSEELIHVKVRNGDAQGYSWEKHTHTALPDWIIDRYDTIDKLFERIKTACDEEAYTITVSYATEFRFLNHA